MSNRKYHARGFTLVELLLVIAIIAILSGLGLGVMAGAEQDALESRTRSGIERISGVLNQKLEANQYRILPVRLPASTQAPRQTGSKRLLPSRSRMNCAKFPSWTSSNPPPVAAWRSSISDFWTRCHLKI